MEFGVVRSLVGEHLEEDFEQALSQASQSAGVAHALLAFLLIIGLSPDAGFAEAVGPEVNGVAKELIARPTDLGFLNVPGLVADGRGARKALEDLVAAIALGMGADGRQKPRGQHLFGAGQTAKEVVVGMALEKGFDLFAIFVELLLEGAQEFAQAQRQPALGLNDRLGNLELIGLRKDGQSPGGRFRSPEFVGVKELFPATFACAHQGLGGRKLDDEVPGGRAGPILKGFQGRRIILDQGLLELVQEAGALFDEAHFILAKETQLMSQWIHGLELFPAVAIDAQGVG